MHEIAVECGELVPEMEVRLTSEIRIHDTRHHLTIEDVDLENELLEGRLICIKSLLSICIGQFWLYWTENEYFHTGFWRCRRGQ